MLRDMYKSWFFFEVTIDLVEMVFVKADFVVVAYYERVFVDLKLYDFGVSLCGEF